MAIPKTVGRYDIIEMVGRGGMGVLYRARDAALERDVALKMMIVDFSVDPAAHERFQREAKAVARLQHRNVVTIHELGEFEGAPYIVMEFLSGQDLEHLLDREKPLTLVEKLDIVSQICEGLGYAHEQGIVHRDIKPANVRVLEDGTVKILDFGIAKFAKSTATQSGTILGTASYMAPEQIMGQQVDGRADLFSTGVLLHELLSGQKPFASDAPTAVVYQIMHVEPPPIRTLVPDLPEALDEIVARALAKNPDERYSRASEMAADLQMVKMMLDLPLQGSESSPNEGPAAAPGKLIASTMRPRTPTTGLTARNIPIKVGAAAPAPAPVAEIKRNNMGMIYGGVGLLAVLGVIGYFVFKGGGGTDVNTTTTTGGGATQTPVTNAGGGATPTTTSAPTPTPTTRPSNGRTGGNTTRSTPGPAASADQVIVTSVPSGAKILVNGADIGKVTPAQVSLAGKPSATISLSLRGYQPAEGTVTSADSGTGKEFQLTREATPVKLSVSGAYPFELVQGSKVISASNTDHDVTLQPGSGNVIARNKGVLLSFPIAVDFGRSSMEAHVPGLGKLTLYGPGECTVSVDGEDLGSPPVPQHQAAAQAHAVVFKCPGQPDQTYKVTVATGETKTVAHQKG